MLVRVQDFEQRPYRQVTKQGMAELAAVIDRVVVAPPHLGSLDVSVGDQVGKDALRGPFGDLDLRGDVAGAALGITRDTEQNVRVVGEKGPGADPGLVLLNVRHAPSSFADTVIAKAYTRQK
jgi:hypothetical protein